LQLLSVAKAVVVYPFLMYTFLVMHKQYLSVK